MEPPNDQRRDRQPLPFELPEITLDYEVNFVVRHLQDNAISGYLGVLSNMACGLWTLYCQVRLLERSFEENSPFQWTIGHDEHVKVVAPMFSWYSVTFADYLRGIRAVAKHLQLEEFPADQWVAPKHIEIYRNKVGAHTSGFTFNKKDRETDRLNSRVAWAKYQSGRYYLPAGRLVINDANSETRSELAPWSLTLEHEAMWDRYFPEQKRASKFYFLARETADRNKRDAFNHWAINELKKGITGAVFPVSGQSLRLEFE